MPPFGIDDNQSPLKIVLLHFIIQFRNDTENLRAIAYRYARAATTPKPQLSN